MIAERLKSARKAMGWSQRELELHSGVRTPIIGRYETGVSIPGQKNLKKLADALKKSPDYFKVPKSIPIGLTPDESVDSEIEFNIEFNKKLKAVKRFSLFDKKVIVGMIDVILIKNKLSAYIKNVSEIAEN
jgi:transcriptional regulator with XRE-family HTH domain